MADQAKGELTALPSHWLPLAALAVASFLLYAQALGFDFTYFDEDVLILDRAHFLRDWRNLPQVFRQEIFSPLTDAHVFYYRPLLTLSLMLDAQLGGTTPFIYHLTNLVLHAAVACLLYWLLIKLRCRWTLAFVLALAFAVHPALAPAVAWVPGRNDVLLTFFAVGAFIALLNFLRTQRWRWYGLHLAALALALLTKETAFVLAPLYAVYAAFVSEQKPRRSARLALPLGWLSLLVGWLLLRQMIAGSIPPPDEGYPLLLLKTATARLPLLLEYVGYLVAPAYLSFFSSSTNQVSPVVWYGWLAATALLLALLLSRRRRTPLVVFGLCWFLLTLLVPLVNPIGLVGLPHRLYLPLVGLLLVLPELDGVKRINLRQPLPAALITLGVVTLATFTFRQIDLFRGRLTFWEETVRRAPTLPFARVNLGRVYYLEGRLDEAEREYEAAITLNPRQFVAYNNLGVIYEERGDLPRAIAAYRKELALHPYDHAFFNLGVIAFQQGKREEAVRYWRKTIAVNPEYLKAYVNLAAYYAEQKNYPEADRYLEQLERRGWRGR